MGMEMPRWPDVVKYGKGRDDVVSGESDPANCEF